MKIYDENQFVQKSSLGMEELDNTLFENEFAKYIIKCMKGPSKSLGDTVLKDKSDFNESRNEAYFDGQFKTIANSIYKYSGKVTMKKINDDKEDCEGNMLAAFEINLGVPAAKVEQNNKLNTKKIEEIIKKSLAKNIGDENGVKEVKINNYICKIAYGKKICGGECKLKIHTIV